jgi:hypothetical protein
VNSIFLLQLGHSRLSWYPEVGGLKDENLWSLENGMQTEEVQLGPLGFVEWLDVALASFLEWKTI